MVESLILVDGYTGCRNLKYVTNNNQFKCPAVQGIFYYD